MGNGCHYECTLSRAHTSRKRLAISSPTTAAACMQAPCGCTQRCGAYGRLLCTQLQKWCRCVSEAMRVRERAASPAVRLGRNWGLCVVFSGRGVTEAPVLVNPPVNLFGGQLLCHQLAGVPHAAARRSRDGKIPSQLQGKLQREMPREGWVPKHFAHPHGPANNKALHASLRAAGVRTPSSSPLAGPMRICPMQRSRQLRILPWP